MRNKKLNDIKWVFLLLVVSVFPGLVIKALSGEAVTAENEHKTAQAFVEAVEEKIEKEMRDPFWPIGYRPKSRESKNEPDFSSTAQMKWPALKVKGLTKGVSGNYIAILENIGVVEAGDIIRIEQNGVIYRWKINAVTKKGVSSTRLDVIPAKK